MMKRKTWILAISVILIAFIAGSFLTNQEIPPAQAQAFKDALDITLSDIQGNAFHLSQLKGKVVLLDFWATWCPICRASIPVLSSLYDDYKDKGVEVVGIALEYDGGQALKKFVKEKNINYTVLIGSEKIAKEYSVFGVPTRFLINSQGEIVDKFVGYQDRETLETAIKEVLE